MTLFIDDKKAYSAKDIQESLKAVGAHDGEVIFLHSDISFGRLASGLKPKEYLGELKNCFDNVGIENLVVPTFTYSFANNETFDVRNSKTYMGAFNEYLRNTTGGGYYRTLDPLLSLCVPKSLQKNYEKLSEHSLGIGGGIDMFRKNNKNGGYKFLFFGARLPTSFTYIHYVEKIKNVPYRFDMKFQGKVVDYNGVENEATQYIHTHCFGIKQAQDAQYFEDYLVENGFLKKCRLGNLSVACISERDAFMQISKKIDGDINYFLDTPFKPQDLICQYGYDPKVERITHC